MKCSDVRILMSEWLDNRCSDGEVTVVRSHIEQCTVCRSHWQAMQDLSRLLRQAEVAMPPPQFTARFMHRLREQGWREPTSRPVSLTTAWAAAFVVLLVAGLVSNVSTIGIVTMDNPSLDLVGLSMSVSAAAVQTAKLADTLVSVTRHMIVLIPRPLIALGILWVLAGTTALMFTLINLVSVYPRSAVRTQVRSH